MESRILNRRKTDIQAWPGHALFSLARALFIAFDVVSQL